jgi:hypothetical protein
MKDRKKITKLLFIDRKNSIRMNLKEQMKAIFQKFGIDPAVHGVKFEEESTATTEITLVAEGTLQDGTKIYSSADEWTTGVDIYTKDADGNPVPVPAGEYLLEDGTMVEVGEDGLVASMEKPEADVELSSADMLAIIDSLSQRISALETEKTKLASALESEKKNAEAVSGELKSVKAELSSLKKAPAASSVRAQEFKKNASPVVASNGNSFSDFMESIRSKQVN